MSFQQYRPTGFSLLPPVVKNLLIINGLFFLATIALNRSFGIDLTDILGLHYFESEKFRTYQIVTYMFMHGSFSHILFNMFAVWMFGSALENYWGSKRFLTYYLITGFGAAFIHYVIVYFELRPTLGMINEYLAEPSIDKFSYLIEAGHIQITSYEMKAQYDAFLRTLTSTNFDLGASLDFMEYYKAELLNAPNVVGASGALFGLLIAFGMLFPNSEIYIYFLLPIKAKYFVILYGILELYSGIQNDPGDNVAHFAHLGGMLFGFILIKLWNRRNTNNFY
jgi:membrane associated rhomboid family serine protease